MSRKTLQITDEMLDDCPAIKAYVTRRLWYAFYREVRIERRKYLNELLKGNGKTNDITGLLNLSGVITKTIEE